MSNRAMKDSGIEWMGEIPSGWDNVKISSIYRESSIKVSDVDYPPLSVTKKGVLPQLENVAKTKNGDNRKLVEVGDFVINSRSDRKGSSGLSAFTGSVSVINTVLKPTTNTSSLYYHFLFKSNLFTEEFYKWGTGIVEDLWSTKWSKMKKINIPLPPLHEQQAIATYLDEQVSRLDQLIEDQQQVIEDWKAYKQSLITETVTKGLNPEVELKDSGIEWIGKIPSHWEVKKVKHVINIGPTYKQKSKPIKDVSFLPMEGLRFRSISPKTDKLLNVLGKYTFFENEDILMAKVTPCFENGNIAIAKNLINGIGFGSSEILTLRCFKALNSFMFYWLQNDFFKNTCILSMRGTGGLKRIPTSVIYNHWFSLPPLHEQQQIADFLDEKCSKIDQLIEDKQRLIEDLKAYKQSLIYECVTGKKEIV